MSERVSIELGDGTRLLGAITWYGSPLDVDGAIACNVVSDDGRTIVGAAYFPVALSVDRQTVKSTFGAIVEPVAIASVEVAPKQEAKVAKRIRKRSAKGGDNAATT